MRSPETDPFTGMYVMGQGQWTNQQQQDQWEPAFQVYSLTEVFPTVEENFSKPTKTTKTKKAKHE